MQRLFGNTEYTGSNHMQLDRSVAILMNNCFNVRQYYRTYGSVINANNPIHRLLSAIPIIDGDVYTVYRRVEEMLPDIIRTSGMVGDAYPGKVQSTGFYGQMCVFMSMELNLYPGSINEYTPTVQALHHPLESLMCTTEPITDTVTDIFAVVGVDIAALVLQYHLWYRVNMSKPKLLQETISQFIGKYVVPNMLESHLDIAMRNRLPRLMSGEPADKEQYRSPIHTVSVDEYIDDAFYSILDKLKRKRLTIATVSSKVPLLFTDSYSQAIPRSIPDSTQGYWATTMVQMGWVSVIIDLFPDLKYRTSYNTLRTIERAINAGTKRYIPNFLYIQYDTELQAIKEKIK